MKEIALLGSTGSIGTQTLEVAARHPNKLRVEALAAGKNLSLLAQQVNRFNPQFVSVALPEELTALRSEIPGFTGTLSSGTEGLIKAATLPSVTHVVVALVGSLGLVPTLEALKQGKTVLLANKETLVAGGHLVTEALQKGKGTLIPIDSEHSAIFQCLKGEKTSEVRAIWLTASGGPFRGWTSDRLKSVTKSQVLTHPIWKMGQKITVDSASLMNKGLEVIEAKWLFGVPADRIKVVIHPQGIVHSMVEFVDGSVIAQLGLPDMKTPIQVALSYPDRWESPPPSLSLAELKTLTFEEPDVKTFPLLGLAMKAASAGGTLPAVLNAANEEGVRLFLEDRISFSELFEKVEEAVSAHVNQINPSLDEVLKADRAARQFVRDSVGAGVGTGRRS